MFHISRKILSWVGWAILWPCIVVYVTFTCVGEWAVRSIREKRWTPWCPPGGDEEPEYRRSL